MQSKIDAIAREMLDCLMEHYEGNETALDHTRRDVLTQHGEITVDLAQLKHLAAFVLSMIEQAKKETRQEARDHMAERGL
jgi:ribosomal protein L17